MTRDWELDEKRRLWPGPPTCRWCFGPCRPPKSRRYCSPTCIHEWKLRSHRSYARGLVWKRDRGVCAGCGAVAQRRGASRVVGDSAEGRWEMDHRVEVADGGTGAMENLTTLCVACHARKTAENRRRRDAERRNLGSESGAA